MVTEGQNDKTVRSNDLSHRTLKSLDSWRFQESQQMEMRYNMENMLIGLKIYFFGSLFLCLLAR